MATATRNIRTAKAVSRVPRAAADARALKWLIYLDNSGLHHWEIVNGKGESLAHSESFASHDDAERAARSLHDNAPMSRFEPSMHETAGV